MVSNIGKIGKIIVTKDLQKIIDQLHYKVGATEWSGVLFYKLTKGDIKKMKDLEFTAEFLYPMNIGSSTYTEFEFSGELMNAYDIHENAMNLSIGQVHTHHNMSTFFSGTDQSELEGNCKNYNFYVSLIVNFAHDYCAKIAFPGKTKTTKVAELKGEDGSIFKVSLPSEGDDIIIGDLDVVIDGYVSVGEWLNQRIAKLEEDKKVLATTRVTPSGPFNNTGTFSKYGGYGGGYNKYFDDGLDAFDAPYQSKKKKATPKEMQFLASLVYLDSKKCEESVSLKLMELLDISDEEQDELLEQVTDNIDVIHAEIYGDVDNLSIHCLEALQELQSFDATYGDSPAYDIVKDVLKENI